MQQCRQFDDLHAHLAFPHSLLFRDSNRRCSYALNVMPVVRGIVGGELLVDEGFSGSKEAGSLSILSGEGGRDGHEPVRATRGHTRISTMVEVSASLSQ